MENKIIKEEVEEYKCKYCGRPLDFDCNEFKEGITFLKKINPFFEPTTGNAWFYCDKCNKSFLIENYAKEGA